MLNKRVLFYATVLSLFSLNMNTAASAPNHGFDKAPAVKKEKKVRFEADGERSKARMLASSATNAALQKIKASEPQKKRSRSNSPQKKCLKGAQQLAVLDLASLTAPPPTNAPIKPAQGSIEDTLLICGFKFLKLSIVRFEKEIESIKEPKAQKKACFMLKAIKSMPFEIIIDSLNCGRKKEDYFEQELQKYCKQNIKLCQHCAKGNNESCKKFKEESQAFHREMHVRDAVEAALVDSGLDSTVLHEAFALWATKNDPTQLAHTVAPQKDLKTVSDLLDAV